MHLDAQLHLCLDLVPVDRWACPDGRRRHCNIKITLLGGERSSRSGVGSSGAVNSGRSTGDGTCGGDG